MSEKYTVELTRDELDALRVQFADSNMVPVVLRGLGEKLRNAQPVQPSALERLEAWKKAHPKHQVDLDGSDHGWACALKIEHWHSDGDRYYTERLSNEFGDTLEAAINAALDAVEGEE